MVGFGFGLRFWITVKLGSLSVLIELGVWVFVSVSVKDWVMVWFGSVLVWVWDKVTVSI